MKTQHTPGPWKLNENRQGRNASGDFLMCITTEDETESIGLVYREPCRDKANANARLIAAAPELLAALEECLGVLESAKIDTTVSYQFASDVGRAKGHTRAALAKAKGL